MGAKWSGPHPRARAANFLGACFGQTGTATRNPRLKGQRPRESRAAGPSGFSAGRPVMPNYFSKEAAAEWRRLVKELLLRGTLTKIDRGILELQAVTYAHWRECLAEIAEKGAFVNVPVTDASGNTFFKRKPNPATALAAADANQMKGFLKELGATPNARKVSQLTKQGRDKHAPAIPAA